MFFLNSAGALFTRAERGPPHKGKNRGAKKYPLLKIFQMVPIRWHPTNRDANNALIEEILRNGSRFFRTIAHWPESERKDFLNACMTRNYALDLGNPEEKGPSNKNPADAEGSRYRESRNRPLRMRARGINTPGTCGET